ncbi:Os07g0498100 [Oryza sativa Japonica Group]|uniref:Os07g0498100 protein n=1 Tax=Oryza sativa subsp. japonica TaxID=39947 RepID=A0A0P0X6Q9_ORYSJ|nr:Os07g0498100 [Oryza sativa Japonica Group]
MRSVAPSGSWRRRWGRASGTGGSCVPPLLSTPPHPPPPPAMPDWGLPPAGLAYLLLVAGYGSMATTSRRRRRQRRDCIFQDGGAAIVGIFHNIFRCLLIVDFKSHRAATEIRTILADHFTSDEERVIILTNSMGSSIGSV